MENEKERKICPLRVIAHTAAANMNRNVTQLCVENQCAWWSRQNDCCAVVALVPEYISEQD